MKKFEQRDGDGALFKNDDKETSQHPDYKGSITVGGVQYWLSAWIKSSKDGTKKYMSLSAKAKEAKPKSIATEPPDFQDDTSLPF